MARVSTKRKSQQQEPEDQGILAHLGLEQPKVDDEKTKQPDTAELLKRIDEMAKQIETVQRTNVALMSAPPVNTSSIERKKPQLLDLKDLPDPTMDREAFNTSLQERLNQAVTNITQAQRESLDSASAQQKAADDLWNEFSDKYEDYAEDKTKVEFAASKAVQKAKARGVDVQKYMFTARDQFFSDVKAEYDAIFGKQAEQEDADVEDEADDNSRTVGIFGGVESGGKPSTTQPQQGDMITDLHALQRKSGFF